MAGRPRGFKHSEETRKKLSEAAKRRKPITGWKHSEETKKRLSEAAKARPKLTHCRKGHELTESNLTNKGNQYGRGCRTCHNANRRTPKARERHRLEEEARRNANRIAYNLYMSQFRKTQKDKRTPVDSETIEYAEILINDICAYCNGPAEAIDHIVPVASRGATHWTNLTPACKRCNTQKNKHSLLKFMLRKNEALV